MGIQDRGYYWERHRGNQKTSTKSLKAVKYFFLPLLVIGIAWFGFSVYLEKLKANKVTPPEVVAGQNSKKELKVIPLKAEILTEEINNTNIKYTDIPRAERPIKKTVTCNEQKVCSTSYSYY